MIAASGLAQLERATGDAGLAVADALAKVEVRLQRKARRMTRDEDLYDDLVQEGMIRLWELDPTRFDLSNRRDTRYLVRAAVNRMWTVFFAETAIALADPTEADVRQFVSMVA